LSNASHEYTRRINRVIDYLSDHRDQPLKLEELAKVACFSEYHFHLVFREMTGETVNDFTNRLRLKKAARLKNSIKNVHYTLFSIVDSGIIPVPLSKQRFAERTFNQAEVLGKSFSENLGIEMDTLSVARITQVAKRRAGMDRKARFASVENAFEVKRPKLIENQNILLIDDVFTSGATATNCAKALKKKGASKVYILTIARTF
jgi:ComF family protein